MVEDIRLKLISTPPSQLFRFEILDVFVFRISASSFGRFSSKPFLTLFDS